MQKIEYDCHINKQCGYTRYVGRFCKIADGMVILELIKRLLNNKISTTTKTTKTLCANGWRTRT